jgi:protein phosphatase
MPALRRGLTPRSFGITDAGRARRGNEDQFLIALLNKTLTVQQASSPRAAVQSAQEQGHLFMVADGMGGHAAGEEASALAVDALETFFLETLKWFYRLEGKDADKVLKEFQTALGSADARIQDEAAQRPQLRGMGTTLTLAYSQEERVFIAHVGDSRCYLFRENALHRITQDHTLVGEFVRRGLLKPEEAAHHPLRHVVTNVLGGNEAGVRVEVHKVPLKPDDVLLLCTDGLTEMVPDEQIAALLRDEYDPEPACRKLIELANARGGKDNITAIVARYEGLPA